MLANANCCRGARKRCGNSRFVFDFGSGFDFGFGFGFGLGYSFDFDFDFDFGSGSGSGFGFNFDFGSDFPLARGLHWLHTRRRIHRFRTVLKSEPWLPRSPPPRLPPPPTPPR